MTGTNPTMVRLKVWPATGTEPTAWQSNSHRHGRALQNPGAVGLTAYLSGGVTNGPIVLRMSDLSARPTAG